MRLFTLIIVVLSLISCSSNFGETKKIVLEFDGFTGDFAEKGNLILVVQDSIILNKITNSFKKSKSSYFFSCPDHRPVAWKINIVKLDERNNTEFLSQIIFTTTGDLAMWDDIVNKCYENDSLINFMIDIVKVEEIRKFRGSMTQEDYDKLLVQ